MILMGQSIAVERPLPQTLNPSHIPPWERSLDREASPLPQEIRDISYQVR